jgi:Flp pilus assembly protein TadD
MTDPELDYRLLAAKVAIAEGRYEEAIDQLDRIAVESQEEEAEKLVLSGQGFEGLNDAARAHDAYTRARALAPEFAAPLLREGVLLYRRGDREGARILLYRYLRAEPGNPEALYYLALCELDRSRRSDAVRSLAVLDGPSAAWSSELLESARD